MEIIILVLAAGVAVWWFFLREKKDQSQPVAPYKVEEPLAPYKVEAMPLGTEAVMVVPATKDNRDLNKDGVVSAEEKAVWVEKLDLNKDGVVDASEKKVAKTRAKPTKLLRAEAPAKPRVKKAT